MTAHELSALLLTLPDVPVMINGWGSDEGVTCEVSKASVIEYENRGPEIHLNYEDLNW